MEFLKKLISDEDGQGVVEYSLMIGLIVLGIWGAVSLLNIPGTVSSLWESVDAALSDPGEPIPE